jgi:hypothetical protein
MLEPFFLRSLSFSDRPLNVSSFFVRPPALVLHGIRSDATIAVEAARLLRGILCSILENTSQECATLRYLEADFPAFSFPVAAAPF